MMENMMKNLVGDLQKDQAKMQLSRVSFQIRKKMNNNLELVATSLNPELLIKAFKQFEKDAKF